MSGMNFEVPRGPFYVDTQSCRCALQLFNQSAVHLDAQESEEAWRCIGDSNEDIYYGDNGKWFLPQHPANFADEGVANDISQPFNWAGNPPDVQKPYIVDNTTHELQPLDDTDQAQLSVFDAVCSGQNSSEQSSKYYKSVKQLQAGHLPTDASTCLAGTSPIELQNASSWQTQGCNLGFFCKCLLERSHGDDRASW